MKAVCAKIVLFYHYYRNIYAYLSDQCTTFVGEIAIENNL